MTSLVTASRRVERRFEPRSGALVSAAIWQPVLFFGAIFLTWEYGVVIFGIRPYLLPRFSAVIVAMWTSHADLIENTYVTLLEVLVGFVAAVVGGVALGVLTLRVALRPADGISVSLRHFRPCRRAPWRR